MTPDWLHLSDLHFFRTDWRDARVLQALLVDVAEQHAAEQSHSSHYFQTFEVVSFQGACSAAKNDGFND